MNRLKLFAIAALAALSLCGHELHDIDIRVMINDKGHARVIETRDYDISSSGTEGYIKQYNLGTMEVGEWAVSDETGTPYRMVEPWDVDAPRAMKTKCCGINRTGDGPELCWGLGKTGRRTYVLRYTLTRLVKSFDDYDGFNFKFFDSNYPHPHHVKVTIMRQDGAFGLDSARVWAFGFTGNIAVPDGAIVAETTAGLEHDHESVTVMARFNKGVFHPVTTAKGTFRDGLLVEAFAGSSYSLEDYDADVQQATLASQGGMGYTPGEEESLWVSLIDALGGLAGSLLWVATPIALLIMIVSRISDYKRDKHLKRLFGDTRIKPRQWSRDIPLDGNLNRVRAVLEAVEGLSSRERQMNAYILRLINAGRLRVVRLADERGEIVRAIAVSDPGIPPIDKGPYSSEMINHLLLQFMWKAADEDHVLQPRELEAYAKASPVEHRQFVKLLNKGLDDLPYHDLKRVTVKQANEVYGLKQFLEEFTMIDERHLEDVGLWREYLVMATLMGIAGRVADELITVWPANMEETLDNMIDTINISGLLSTSMRHAVSYVEKYETPAERAMRRAAERSSGSGGRSSSGGGGGSSGGGGSGIR